MSPAHKKALKLFGPNGILDHNRIGSHRWQVLPMTLDVIERQGLAIRVPPDAIAWEAKWILTLKGLRAREGLR